MPQFRTDVSWYRRMLFRFPVFRIYSKLNFDDIFLFKNVRTSEATVAFCVYKIFKALYFILIIIVMFSVT